MLNLGTTHAAPIELTEAQAASAEVLSNEQTKIGSPASQARLAAVPAHHIR